MASGQEAEPSPSTHRIEQADLIQRLVRQLDADDFSTRQFAQTRLVEIGEPALSSVDRATQSESPEQRYRARIIIKLIRTGSLQRAFAEFGHRNDDEINVEEGMWLISRILDPDVTRKELSSQLDELAEALKMELGPDKDLANVPPREVANAIRTVLGTQYRLAGSVANYDHPDNSSLHRVLKRRQGLPILLSHLAVSVAKRLDLPIVGIGVPSRYMIKYDGARAPEGSPKEDLIVDPFGGWRVLAVGEVSTVVRTFDPARHLTPSPPRSTLARMLRNLESDFAEVGQSELAAEVETYRLLLENVSDSTVP